MATDSLSRILELISDETGVVVEPDTTLDSLNLESLDFLELITSFEKKFNTKVPDDKFGDLHKVSDLLAFLPV